MKWNTSNKTLLGYGAALVLLIVTFFFTFYQTTDLLHYTGQVKQDISVINKLNEFFVDVKNVEKQFREGVLRNVNHTSSFRNSYRHTADGLAYLLQLEKTDTIQFHLKEIGDLLDAYYRTGLSLMTQYKQTNFQMDSTFKNQALDMMLTMEKVYDRVSHINQAEKLNLYNQYNRLSETSHTVKYVNIFLFVTAILLASYSLITYSKEHKAKQQADEKIKTYARELEERVTELNKTNKELSTLRSLEKFAATGRIARTIAHEVRNPLTNINLAADQIRHQLSPENTDNDALINIITRNSTRINQLIGDLLNSTKFLELNYEKYSINKLLDETLELAKDRITLQEIQVQKKFQSNDNDTNLLLDVEKMKIAFLNIIVNAIEAMEPGKGMLTLTTSLTDSKCIISIADNGKGIDKESLNKLFEPYFTKKIKGSGLGLTNTHNIIYTHKGTIEVISAIGLGTTFTVTLNKDFFNNN